VSKTCEDFDKIRNVARERIVAAFILPPEMINTREEHHSSRALAESKADYYLDTVVVPAMRRAAERE
jgi:capsid portal protein